MRLRSLDEVDLVAGLELHDGFLPLRPSPLVTSHALELAREGGRADGDDLHVEDRLDGGTDLHLVGVRSHLEGHGVEVFLLLHALLGHERANDDVARVPVHWLSASSRATRPPRSNTTR